MTEAQALDAFPRRPIGVRAGRRATLVAAATGLTAAACLGGAAYFAVSLGGDLVREARVWESGRPVPARGAEGRCLVRLALVPFATCTLRVTYERTPGEVVTRPAEAVVFVGLGQSDAPLRVKVDPADPDSFAASLLVEERAPRWLAFAVLVGGLALLGLVLGGGGWRSLREYRLWRALARQPWPVSARMTTRQLVSSPGWAWEYGYEYELNGAVRTGRQRLRVLKGEHGVAPADWRYEEPVRLPGGARLLALAGPKGALLVTRSFWPLVLTEEERGRILAQAEPDLPR